MCCLVMSLCLLDLHMTSLNNNYYNTLNSSRLTVVQLTQRLVFGWYNINLKMGVIILHYFPKQNDLLSNNVFVELFLLIYECIMNIAPN